MQTHTPKYPNPGPRLREIRLERGLTQVELARRLGIGQTTLSAIERGAQVVTLPTLCRFADALDFTWGYDGEHLFLEAN